MYRVYVERPGEEDDAPRVLCHKRQVWQLVIEQMPLTNVRAENLDSGVAHTYEVQWNGRVIVSMG